jgi:superfamily II RNA helicase
MFIRYNDVMKRPPVSKEKKKRKDKKIDRRHQIEVKKKRDESGTWKVDARSKESDFRFGKTASSAALNRLLEGIGEPEPAPIVPDPFQLEALQLIESCDVLVTAPTGSGKTWIAREEIRRLLAEGKSVWYTTPLKALTNSKYQEFGEEFGAENVGILTGDRKENSNAPIIVGTTEIYRNQLFDALRGGEDIRADLVVLDEAHYLADEDRGHVWEEAIILSPPRVRLLLLSATIGNAKEFASWIEEVRGVPCAIVPRPGDRPVPLRAGFLYPDSRLIPLLNESGKLNLEIERLGQHEERQPRNWSFRRRR